MFKFLIKHQRQITRGQALVETALVLTLLIVLVSSIIEFGFMLNSYMSLQDAARNASRYASDSLYDHRDNIYNCNQTQDFYRQTACLVTMEISQSRPLETLTYTLTGSTDDIVISAFSISGAGGSVVTPTVTARYPTEFGEAGYSFSQDWYGARHQFSQFTSAQISQRLNHQAPSTGFILIEIFGHYDQKLKLPWITAFLHDPYPLYTYAFMPLVSAEPQAAH